MNILQLAKGKKISVMTDMNVEVQLEIKSIKEDHHSQDLEPATRENDWWPPSREWKTYTVNFTNGATKSYSSLEEIKFID